MTWLARSLNSESSPVEQRYTCDIMKSVIGESDTVPYRDPLRNCTGHCFVIISIGLASGKHDLLGLKSCCALSVIFLSSFSQENMAQLDFTLNVFDWVILFGSQPREKITAVSFTPFLLVYFRSLSYRIAVRNLFKSLGTVYLIVHFSSHNFQFQFCCLFQYPLPKTQSSSNLCVLKGTILSVLNHWP